MQVDIKSLTDEKLFTKDADTKFNEIKHVVAKYSDQNTQLKNQQISLENWVEKYLPLKLHHMIQETVG